MKQPDWQSEDGRYRMYCGDCAGVMAEMSDGLVDVTVTDPPYGIKADRRQKNRAGKQHGKALAPSKDYGESDWDKDRPSPAAFSEIRRVSRHQVVFGGNYFADLLPPSASWIVWDKDNGTNAYADFELAWTSHKRAARKVRWRWHGMLQEPGHPKDKREHPTQKPRGVMVWVLENYTEPDDLVADFYAGAGTTGVACVGSGRRFIGVEQSPAHFATAVRRIEAAIRAKSEQLVA